MSELLLSRCQTSSHLVLEKMSPMSTQAKSHIIKWPTAQSLPQLYTTCRKNSKHYFSLLDICRCPSVPASVTLGIPSDCRSPLPGPRLDGFNLDCQVIKIIVLILILSYCLQSWLPTSCMAAYIVCAVG